MSEIKVDKNKRIYQNGRQIGRIDGPYVVNAANHRIGMVDRNVIKDKGLHPIAKIDGNRILNKAGHPVGKITDYRIKTEVSLDAAVLGAIINFFIEEIN